MQENNPMQVLANVIKQRNDYINLTIDNIIELTSHVDFINHTLTHNVSYYYFNPPINLIGLPNLPKTSDWVDYENLWKRHGYKILTNIDTHHQIAHHKRDKDYNQQLYYLKFVRIYPLSEVDSNV